MASVTLDAIKFVPIVNVPFEWFIGLVVFNKSNKIDDEDAVGDGANDDDNDDDDFPVSGKIVVSVIGKLESVNNSSDDDVGNGGKLVDVNDENESTEGGDVLVVIASFCE